MNQKREKFKVFKVRPKFKRNDIIFNLIII